MPKRKKDQFSSGFLEKVIPPAIDAHLWGGEPLSRKATHVRLPQFLTDYVDALPNKGAWLRAAIHAAYLRDQSTKTYPLKTMNYKLITGPLAGEIVPEGYSLGRFSELDEDMKVRVREFGEEKYGPLDGEDDFPVSLDELTQEYCNSWQDEETDLPATLW